MNAELKEKMQKAAENYVAGKWRKTTPVQEKRIETAVILGAEAMYAELAPLVEWVSVEDKLPAVREIVLLKDRDRKFAFGYNKGRYIHVINPIDFNIFEVTHWRKIEL